MIVNRFMPRIVVMAFFVLGVSGPAYSETKPERTMKDRLEALIGREWESISGDAGSAPEGPGRVVWKYRVSPAFPSEWPPGPTARLYYYAYAYGLELGGSFSDAELVAAPWAKVETRPGGETPLTLVRLFGEIRELGPQGVRPLTEDESAIFRRWGLVDSYLASLRAPPDESAPETQHLRNFFCAWLDFNSVIAAQIRPRHEPFFTWLTCGAKSD